MPCSNIPQPPFLLLCDRCLTEGLAGEAKFTERAGLGDLLDFEPAPRRVDSGYASIWAEQAPGRVTSQIPAAHAAADFCVRPTGDLHDELPANGGRLESEKAPGVTMSATEIGREPVKPISRSLGITIRCRASPMSARVAARSGRPSNLGNRPVGGRYSSPIRSAAMNASCGMLTEPYSRILFLPSFCLSRSLRFREMSPP